MINDLMNNVISAVSHRKSEFLIFEYLAGKP